MSFKVQVVFYSMYGHVYRLAEAIAEGAKRAAGAEVGLYQVPELVPDAILEKSSAKAARQTFAHIPIARVDQLPEADAILFGTPTRFGNMCPDAQLSRSDRWAVGQGVADRQGGQCLCQHGNAARWPRNNDHQLSLDALPPRYDRGRCSVLVPRSREHERNHGWDTVRRHHDCRRGWFPTTERERTCHRPFSRQACRRDHRSIGCAANLYGARSRIEIRPTSGLPASGLVFLWQGSGFGRLRTEVQRYEKAIRDAKQAIERARLQLPGQEARRIHVRQCSPDEGRLR